MKTMEQVLEGLLEKGANSIYADEPDPGCRCSNVTNDMWNSHGWHMYMSEEGVPTALEWCPFYVHKMVDENKKGDKLTYYVDPENGQKLKVLVNGASREKKVGRDAQKGREAIAGND
jgi:hypothetical protein